MLDSHGVKATFFPIGNRLNERWESDDLQDLLNRGHAIGNHSWGHRELTKLNDSDLIFQLEESSSLISKLAGYRPSCFRAPFGERDFRVLSAAKTLGMDHVAWSVDPKEWNDPTIDEAMEHVSERLEDGAIVLLHDRRFLTLPIVSAILEKFPSSEWEYRTIPSCGSLEFQSQRIATRKAGDLPLGSVDETSNNGNKIIITGWAYDSDLKTGGLQILSPIEGDSVKVLAFTNSQHEFKIEIESTRLIRPLCLWAKNEGKQVHDVSLGCHLPIGRSSNLDP